MSFLKKLWSGKKKDTSPEIPGEPKPVETELEKFCGDDKETYDALFDTMFLDPTKAGVSLKDAVANAIKYEAQKDFTQAKIWYQITGGLAIYEGDVAKVKEYFGKAKKISEEMLLKPVNYPILNNPEKAVMKAQEFYKQHPKQEEKPR
jgi:hypothetical protein